MLTKSGLVEAFVLKTTFPLREPFCTSLKVTPQETVDASVAPQVVEPLHPAPALNTGVVVDVVSPAIATSAKEVAAVAPEVYVVVVLVV